MPALGPDRWKALSPYLDQALELSPGERTSWLAALRGHDPTLADEVAALLAEGEALAREGFLEGSPLRPARASLAGQTVGGYALVSLVGQGGMGSVWLAQRSDGRFEGRAAVKLLNASLVGHEGEARFKREADILSRLTHPNIGRLLDAGVSPLGQPYLVLEFVDGQPIDRHCDNLVLGVEARLRLVLDVLGAVAHAHAHLVVHRDIKPSNVLVTPDGRAKLLDFGIAKLLQDDANSMEGTPLTREGGLLLTPGYAAPEQVTGAPITTTTDVYALGVLLFELLAGRHPAGDRLSSTAEWVKAVVDTEPARLSEAVVRGEPLPPETLVGIAARRGRTPEQLRRAFRGDLDTILATALKKDPRERYPSVGAFGDDLHRHLDHRPIAARADTWAYRTAKFIRRNRVPSAFAAATVVALVGGLAGTLIQARRATSQAAYADRERARADEQARVAAAQRDFALRQLSRAEAINDLNAFVLSDAAPLGKPFTARDLLARAEHIVEGQRGETEENQVELLIAVGRQYLTLDEDARGRKLLERAHEVAAGLPERGIRAKAACALASAVTYAGDVDRGRKLVQEALADLPNEPPFALHRVFCLLRGAEVGREAGDYDLAIERVIAAQGVLADSSVTSPSLDLSVSMALAESYRMAGRNREASRAFQEAARRLSELGREDTETAGTLLNDWGLAVMALGRPLEAETLFRRAIALSRAGGSERNVSPMLLNNLARTLRELRRLEEASDYAERAYVTARQAGAESIVSQALMVRATVYRLRGDSARAAQMLSELEPRWRRALPAANMALANLASEQSALAQAHGNLRAAVEASDRAIAIAEGSPQKGDYLAAILERRSDLDRQRGRLDEAREYAERALRMELDAGESGAVSYRVGRAYLVLGLALDAQGEVDQGRSAFRAALEHLEPCLGAAHPDARLARRLATTDRRR